jgi:hypothetical protein
MFIKGFLDIYKQIWNELIKPESIYGLGQAVGVLLPIIIILIIIYVWCVKMDRY